VALPPGGVEVSWTGETPWTGYPASTAPIVGEDIDVRVTTAVDDITA
jgi:hypothetical protein